MSGSRQAWQSAPVALAVFDRQQRLVEANARMLALLNRSGSDAAGLTLSDLFDDEATAETLQRAFEQRQGGPLALSWRGQFLLATAWRLEDGAGGWALACDNPTPSGLVRPGASETVQLLATAVAKNPDAVFIKDREGRHMLANPACAEIIGRPIDEILGRDVSSLFPADIAARMLEVDRQVLEGGQALTMEETIPHRGTGQPRVFLSRKLPFRDPDGTVIGLIGFGWDVTETRAAEAALRQSEGKFRQLVEQATDAFFLHDSGGDFLDVNEQACRSLGYSRDELLQMNVADVDLSWPVERMRTEFDALLSELPVTLEGLHRRKDGSSFPVEVRVGWFEAGQDRLLLALARDITERKVAEKQLRLAQRQLEERVRLRTRDLEAANLKLSREIEDRRRVEQTLADHRQRLENLTGGLLEMQEADRRRLAGELHDDLTQRLAALSIEAGRLRESNGRLPEAVVEGLEGITRQCVELSVDIHRMARQLHPSILEDLGAIDAIRSECESFQQRHGIGMSCEAVSLPNSLSRSASLCLYRVVQESLTNVARHAEAGRVQVRLEAHEGELVLTIADDGKGFLVTETEAGLGLISMQERVRRLNGRLEIVSRPAQGTTVRMVLPGV